MFEKRLSVFSESLKIAFIPVNASNLNSISITLNIKKKIKKKPLSFVGIACRTTDHYTKRFVLLSMGRKWNPYQLLVV